MSECLIECTGEKARADIHRNHTRTSYSGYDVGGVCGMWMCMCIVSASAYAYAYVYVYVYMYVYMYVGV